MVMFFSFSRSRKKVLSRTRCVCLCLWAEWKKADDGRIKTWLAMRGEKKLRLDKTKSFSWLMINNFGPTPEVGVTVETAINQPRCWLDGAWEREKDERKIVKISLFIHFSHRQLNVLSLTHTIKEIWGEIFLVTNTNEEIFSLTFVCEPFHGSIRREWEKMFSLNFFRFSVAFCDILFGNFSFSFSQPCSIVDKIEANLMNYCLLAKIKHYTLCTMAVGGLMKFNENY